VDTAFDTLRAIGLSNAKANYIQNVARFELEQGMSFSKLSKMSDEEVISYLTQIKGVGRWTVEMLLMFALGREDLFAMDDLGLQQAVIGLYGLKHRKKKQCKPLSKKFRSNGHPTALMPACIFGNGRIIHPDQFKKTNLPKNSYNEKNDMVNICNRTFIFQHSK
jgi:hypothetical protein